MNKHKIENEKCALKTPTERPARIDFYSVLARFLDRRTSNFLRRPALKKKYGTLAQFHSVLQGYSTLQFAGFTQPLSDQP